MTGRPTVMHVVEAFGGGVQTSLAHFVNSAPFANHLVLGRARAGETTQAPSAEVVMHAGSAAGFARQMRRMIRTSDPEVVHFHSSKAGLLRPLVSAGRRRIYSPHCYAFERQDVPRTVRLAFRAAETALSRATDAVVAVSPYEASLAKALNPSGQVENVSNLASFASFRPSRSEQRRVVTVGRIAPQKSPDLFARIAELASSDIEFVWVGDGEGKLRSRLQRAGVRVTGWLSPESVEEELTMSALYLHTAAWEASPMSLAQALSAGVPVICRTLPTLESLGYFCVENSAQSLADSVIAFFDRPTYASKVRSGAANAVTRLTATDTSAGLRRAYLGPHAEVVMREQ